MRSLAQPYLQEGEREGKEARQARRRLWGEPRGELSSRGQPRIIVVARRNNEGRHPDDTTRHLAGHLGPTRRSPAAPRPAAPAGPRPARVLRGDPLPESVGDHDWAPPPHPGSAAGRAGAAHRGDAAVAPAPDS